MEAAKYVVAVIEALDGAGVPYMIVGSLSASAYGISRSTKDADFVVELGDASIMSILGRFGPEFRLHRQMGFETNTGTVKNVMNVGESGFQIELFRLSSDGHDRERFSRRRSALVPPLSRSVFIPTAEDVLITKLRWVLSADRVKDREDVKTILAVQRGKFDSSYVARWCREHGTTELLQNLEKEAPQP